MDGTKLNNPKDPIGKTENSGRELFKRFGVAAVGFNYSTVIDAASNILLNAMRQTYPKRAEADVKMAELTGKLRGMLMDMYDPVSGQRRNIFPFTQHINVPFLKDVDKVN